MGVVATFTLAMMCAACQEPRPVPHAEPPKRTPDVGAKIAAPAEPGGAAKPVEVAADLGDDHGPPQPTGWRVQGREAVLASSLHTSERGVYPEKEPLHLVVFCGEDETELHIVSAADWRPSYDFVFKFGESEALKVLGGRRDDRKRWVLTKPRPIVDRLAGYEGELTFSYQIEYVVGRTHAVFDTRGGGPFSGCPDAN